MSMKKNDSDRVERILMLALEELWKRHEDDEDDFEIGILDKNNDQVGSIIFRRHGRPVRTVLSSTNETPDVNPGRTIRHDDTAWISRDGPRGVACGECGRPR